MFHSIVLTLQGRIKELLTTDLTLFPRVMKSVDIGVKLKSCDIEEKSMTHFHETQIWLPLALTDCTQGCVYASK